MTSYMVDHMIIRFMTLQKSILFKKIRVIIIFIVKNLLFTKKMKNNKSKSGLFFFNYLVFIFIT